MTDTRVISITVEAYGNIPAGRFSVMGEGFNTVLNMTPDEARNLLDQAFRFFELRQKSIGKSIAEATLPNLLSAPVDADFSEVAE